MNRRFVIILALVACAGAALASNVGRHDFTLAPIIRVAEVGDSLTNPNLSFAKLPDVTKELAGERYFISQQGIPGDSLASSGGAVGMYTRWRSIRNEPWTHVFFLGGLNDINLGLVTGDVAANRAFALYADAIDAGVTPIGVQLLPVGGYVAWNGTKQTNLERFNLLILDAGIPIVLAYDSMRVQDGGTAMDPQFAFSDQAHLNDAGTLRLASLYLAALRDAGAP